MKKEKTRRRAFKGDAREEEVLQKEGGEGEGSRKRSLEKKRTPEKPAARIIGSWTFGGIKKKGHYGG